MSSAVCFEESSSLLERREERSNASELTSSIRPKRDDGVGGCDGAVVRMLLRWGTVKADVRLASDASAMENVGRFILCDCVCVIVTSVVRL